ncbi:MAG: amidohydrolase family protein [Myxococcales bacterium]|nr:amidohydrolase family protein [Myxococcales bacterium]
MPPRALLLAAPLLACATAPPPAQGPGPVCPVASTPAPLSAPASLSLPPGAPSPALLLLKNARLIDGTGAAPRTGVDVLVEAGRIKQVGQGLAAPAGVVTLDLGGRTLLPGLIDAHTHLANDPQPSHAEAVVLDVTATDADAALRGAANARVTLLAGFTTVRNVGGTFADRSLRDAIRRGRIPGPRILVANHAIGITGGHCDDTNGLRPDIHGRPPDFEEGIADGPDAVRRAVRHQIKHGADVIKICATGGVLSQGDGVGAPQLTPDELAAVVDEAVRAERKVAAHAHGTEGIKDAVKAGVHSIEHGSMLDDEAIRLMKKRGTYLVPTVAVGAYVEQAAQTGKLSPDSAAKALAVAPRMRDSLARAYKAGVKIAFGTDAGVFEHGTNAREFSALVALGVTPMDAILSATRNAADLLGLSDVGVIKPGNVADLLVVDGDPLADIRALERPALVVHDGVIVRPPSWQ